MPSFADSAVIIILALMLFGPKKLPQLARQLGKLMAEFRKASNEFRMQMEDELRIEEQKEHQSKVDAMAGPPSDLPEPEHPHMPSPALDAAAQESAANPITPIASSGELKMMPPSTGLPVESATYGTTPKIIEEHSILPPEHITEIGTGMSSEEPAAEATPQHEQAHA